MNSKQYNKNVEVIVSNEYSHPAHLDTMWEERSFPCGFCGEVEAADVDGGACVECQKEISGSYKPVNTPVAKGNPGTQAGAGEKDLIRDNEQV